MTRTVLATLAAALLGWACGCAPKESDNAKLQGWIDSVSANLPPGLYIVEPPDVLEISSPAIKELDKAGGKVRPDGRISLNLIGEVYVAGKTTDQITQDILKLLAKYYNTANIDLTVSVKEFNSKTICVIGQVYSQGLKPYTGRDTILKVLADAKLNDRAWPQRVVIVRPSDDPAVKQKVTVDLKRMYEQGDTTQNYLLEAGDLVYVPPSPLAELNMKFQQVVMPLVPMGTAMSLARGGI